MTELDGLRALAIGAVLAFHCLHFPTNGHSLAAYAERLPLAGWGGVDIFFALSGFLVGGILIDGRGKPHQLRNFLLKRFVRIVPLYAVVVATFFVLSRLIVGPWLFGDPAPGWSYATLTQNFAVPIIGHDALYLGPTWSLAVEAQVYIALGLFLSRAPERCVLPAMLSGIVLAEVCRIIATAAGQGLIGYFTVPARIDGACFGVIAALAVRSEFVSAIARARSRLIWSAAGLLIAGAAGLGIVGEGPGSSGANLYTHLALAGAAAGIIVALVVAPDSWQAATLRWRPLRALGTVSYGVYLLHIPAIGLAHEMLGRPGLALNDGMAALATALGLLLAVAIAALSWRYFETPLNLWAHRVTALGREARRARAATRENLA